jgi:peptidoglycan/LPS O-acetylase OafA/YrhL
VTHMFLPEGTGLVFSMGGVGVSFFFVLSGFVLTWSRDPSLAKGKFYRNRFARIYPLHFLTWLLAAGIIFWSGSMISLPVAVSTLVLVQSWIPFENFYFGMNGPSWSLSCEAFFYAVFPFLAPAIARRSNAWVAKSMVALFIIVAIFTLTAHLLLQNGPTIALLYVNPVYRLWEFLLGIGLARLVATGWRIGITLRIAFMITAIMFALVTALNVAVVQHLGVFAMIPMQGLPSDIASLAMIPCFILLIAAAASTELRGRRSHVGNPAFVTLGKWSFALYLSHLLIVSAVKMLLPEPLTLPLGIMLAIAIILAAIGVSGTLYRVVELPLEQRLRSRRTWQASQVIPRAGGSAQTL